MTPAKALRRVVLPQAMSSIIPASGNQLISLVKATSEVSVIAMADLLYTVQSVYNRTFQTIPLLLVAVLWYLLITSVLNVAQGFIEYHYARGSGADETTLAAMLMKRFGAAPSPGAAHLGAVGPQEEGR